MIQSLGQVMLYVENVEESAQFWQQKMGFEFVQKQEQGGQISYIIAPQNQSDVQFVLHNKAFVKQMNPEMNLGTPSILMSTQNIEQTHQQLEANGVAVNPIADLGFMKVFNFSDNEGNYFAVREVKK